MNYVLHILCKQLHWVQAMVDKTYVYKRKIKKQKATVITKVQQQQKKQSNTQTIKWSPFTIGMFSNHPLNKEICPAVQDLAYTVMFTCNGMFIFLLIHTYPDIFYTCLSCKFTKLIFEHCITQI